MSESKWDDDVLGVNMSGVEKLTHWEYRPIRDKIVTARKSGPCANCRQEIVPGTRIRSLTDWLDGEIATRRFCNVCCNAMAVSWTDDGEALCARYELGLNPTTPETER